MTVEKFGYSPRSAPRNVIVNLGNLVEDFIVDSVPVLNLGVSSNRIEVGNQYELRWNYENINSSSTLLIRLINGSDDTIIADNVPIQDGAFLWTVPDQIPGDALVEIEVIGSSEIKNSVTISISNAGQILSNSIRYLNVLTGSESLDPDHVTDDIDYDGMIGLPEVINNLMELQ